MYSLRHSKLDYISLLDVTVALDPQPHGDSDHIIKILFMTLSLHSLRAGTVSFSLSPSDRRKSKLLSVKEWMLSVQN